MPGCHGRNLAAGTRSILNFSSSINLQQNGGALCEELSGRIYFDEFMPTFLRGAVFLKTQSSYQLRTSAWREGREVKRDKVSEEFDGTHLHSQNYNYHSRIALCC